MNGLWHTRWKKILWLGLMVAGVAGLLATVLQPEAEAVTFRNPLNVSYGSDPWLVVYDGSYYLATTSENVNKQQCSRGTACREK